MSIKITNVSVCRSIVDGVERWGVTLKLKGPGDTTSRQHCKVDGLDPEKPIGITAYSDAQGNEEDYADNETFKAYCASPAVRRAIEGKLKSIFDAYPDGPFPDDIGWVDAPAETHDSESVPEATAFTPPGSVASAGDQSFLSDLQSMNAEGSADRQNSSIVTAYTEATQ
jgi:hypothetical protein